MYEIDIIIGKLFNLSTILLKYKIILKDFIKILNFERFKDTDYVKKSL